MEFHDPDSHAPVALSPGDFVLAESMGVAWSREALNEFESGFRDCKTGRMLGAHVARSIEKDTWIILGRKRYYLVLHNGTKTYTFDAPNIASATDYIIVSGLFSFYITLCSHSTQGK